MIRDNNSSRDHSLRCCHPK